MILFTVYTWLGSMVRDDEPIRSMTLGNMRHNGVRGLFVTCQHCGDPKAANDNEPQLPLAFPSGANR